MSVACQWMFCAPCRLAHFCPWRAAWFPIHYSHQSGLQSHAYFGPSQKIRVSIPAAIASSAAYWIKGLSTIGNNSFGIALVAGRKRVPKPATGKTAFRSAVIRVKPFLDNLEFVFKYCSKGGKGSYSKETTLLQNNMLTCQCNRVLGHRYPRRLPQQINQNPDTLIRRNFFDLRHKICEWSA